MFDRPVTADDEVFGLLEGARRAAANLEMGRYAGRDALKLVEALGQTERALAAAKARAASHAVENGHGAPSHGGRARGDCGAAQFELQGNFGCGASTDAVNLEN